jgi:UDP:flavonoid glycosyltransferase YjiC (YdhE family)
MAPMSVLSVHDFPILPGAERFTWIVRGGPAVTRLIRGIGRLATRNWIRPLVELRAELGLPPGPSPIFEGKFSPFLPLALFSSLFGPPQPDWPPDLVPTGFPFYDAEDEGHAIEPELEAFLQAGPPPLVFTLGSAAVYLPGRFYEESLKAAQAVGRRAVLLIGKNPPPSGLPDSAIASDYAPYSKIFPRAAAIVHSGGIGTTSQALRAGRPMIVMPFSFDQFDNATRVVRLGAGRSIIRGQYNPESAARELRALLEDPSYAAAAESAGKTLRSERGAAAACDRVEALLKNPGTRLGRP